ncbi:MAG: biotin transporter BioY [Treponema sp.]|jgi:biotin transport system substrate-specific component|nr:biotin transporter BioY [Treponema sp.]
METVIARQPKRKTIIGLTLTALFAALIAAGTFIAIPLPFSPVPIVLQNMFALLAGLILGPLRGGAAVGLYLIAGAIGAPVFAGASGGVVRMLGPTGGFLLGYLLSALTAGFILGNPGRNKTSSPGRIILAVVAGLLIVYIPGVLWLKRSLDVSWIRALSAGFFPYLIGDAIKGLVAGIILPRLRRAVADQLYG